MGQLEVWAERLEGFVRVGTIAFGIGANERFEYDAAVIGKGVD